MKVTENDIVGEVVAENYKAASIFKSNDIDFCCKGNRSIKEVCSTKGLNSEDLINELNNALTTPQDGEVDFKTWPLDLLTDYIEKKHHSYVENKIQEIKPYLEKVATVHGAQNPELYEIKELFETGAGELTAHMKKEELVLFPAIRKYVNANKSDESADTVKIMSNPINAIVTKMREEHDTEGERFRKIAELSNNYTPPSNACNTYKVTYALLKEFENDLHLHIHLENNILFPKAIKLDS